MNDLFSLSGKFALVTGGANGQGFEVAKAFAAAGAMTVVLDKDAEGLERLQSSPVEGGGSLVGLPCDIGRRAEMEAAIASALPAGESIDVLYSNAAVYLRGRGDGKTHEVPSEVWERTFATNLMGAIQVTQAVLPGMLEKGRGSLIHVATTGALVGSDVHAYSAAKGGLLSLSRSLAHSYGPQGIRSNCLVPGLVRTQMSEPLFNDAPALERFVSSIPLRRAGEPHEVIGAALFLASEASSYVTGAALVVDGGRTIAG